VVLSNHALLDRTRSHNTRRARTRRPLRASAVTTASSPDTVVRRSQSSTRRCVFIVSAHIFISNHTCVYRPRRQRRLYCVSSALYASTRCSSPSSVASSTSCLHCLLQLFYLTIFLSFELGGEKKTKGAALTFVRPFLSSDYARSHRVAIFVVSTRCWLYPSAFVSLSCNASQLWLCSHASMYSAILRGSHRDLL
jgi:hypothetical protein